MGSVRELDLKLTDWEVRYLLDALSKEMSRLRQINSESDDEDEAADAGNDLLEMAGLFESLSEKAVATFGDQILNFGAL